MKYGSQEFYIHRLMRIAKGFLAIGQDWNYRFCKRQALKLVACYAINEFSESSQKHAEEFMKKHGRKISCA